MLKLDGSVMNLSFNAVVSISFYCFDLREVQEIAIKDIIERSRHDLLDLQEEHLDVEGVLSDLVLQLDDCC